MKMSNFTELFRAIGDILYFVAGIVAESLYIAFKLN